ncbi:uncharacterized protein LOC110816898 [Carica papaya]|uniref:uncharacterized protein LOC110816898 n=1 Tax=Carica papaya TaxID=3649 RepID=UPI000B8CC1C3|nr:uncharacterized protein LOC110816898 [Carica papaya]
MVDPAEKVVNIQFDKFYETSLSPQVNKEQLDPFSPSSDPLDSCTNEVHKSKGGLNDTHLRFEDCIEGNINKLNNKNEKLIKKTSFDCKTNKAQKRSQSISPPPAPIAIKRRRRFLYSGHEDDDNEGEKDCEFGRLVNKRIVRKLLNDFSRVANNA